MSKMPPSACKDALQEVHNSVTDMVKEVANEPSVGLYFVQQHVHKAVPGLLALKSRVVEATDEAILYTHDVNDALASVKVMNEIGPTVFKNMMSTLNSSLHLLPTLHHPKTGNRPPPPPAHLPRSATHHGAVALPSSPSGTKDGVDSERSIPEAAEKISRASTPGERLPAVTPRSSSSRGNSNPSSTPPDDTSGFVSSFLSSAYQRANSVRMSMPTAFEVKESVAKQDNASEVLPASTTNTSTSSSNAGYLPSIPYWNVFESAIQKAGHMVGAGGTVSGDSFRRSPFVRSFSASNLSDSAHKNPPMEASASRVLEELQKLDEEGHVGLNVEDPEVVESFARLQQEQAAKLEEWLGTANEDESTPQSLSS